MQPINNNPGEVVLYSYWRSSCSWRVRIALNIKGIKFEYRAVNLVQSEQKSSEYFEINPGKVVPTLIIDNHVLTQSVAILEYLEERVPQSWRLMPGDSEQRAIVRSFVNVIACDIQPLQNLKVLLTFEESKRTEWAKEVITNGFITLEAMLKKYSGTCCIGDDLTLADVCLVPQVYNARRYNVDMTKFPLISKLEQYLSSLEAFKKAHPDNQPDAIK